MELILPAACAAAGGAALAAAWWRSCGGACVWLGLAAGGVAVLAAAHDAGSAAALLLVQAAVGLAVTASGVLPGTPAGRRRRLMPAAVVLGVGTLVAAALASGAAEGLSPAYPPRSGPLVLAVGGLLLLSAIVGISALSRGRAAASRPSRKAS